MNTWLCNLGLVAQTAGGWLGSLSELEPELKFTLLVVAIGCGTGVICTVVVFVSNTITSIHGRRLDADMKREMIERGMSADEIAKILEAASPPEDATQRWIASWAKTKKL
jgi:hypothetical protein